MIVMHKAKHSPRGIEQEPLHHGAGLAPFREPLFRRFWIVAVISYTGTWMQNVGIGWEMTCLTVSPMMVSLVQVATSLPVFLVVLPAGALADMVDRRRMLLVCQSWMVVAAATLGVLAMTRCVSPWILLIFTFLLGAGTVMNDPAWQAITPELVSVNHHKAAVALNSAGFNVARAVGPALGGLIIATVGSGAAFLLNALSFFGVIFFLHTWKRSQRVHGMARKPILPAIRTGFHHARQSPEVRAVLVRTGVFSLSGCALLAMLPLIARPFGSIGYGLLLGSFGVGAVLGAAILPIVRRQLSEDQLVALATMLFALVTYASSRISILWFLCIVLFAAGVGWITILAILNVVAQTMSADWVRARSISMYVLVLQGGMAIGSAIWGAVATKFGVSTAMTVAAMGLVSGLAAIHRHRLGTVAKAELPASRGSAEHWWPV